MGGEGEEGRGMVRGEGERREERRGNQPVYT